MSGLTGRSREYRSRFDPVWSYRPGPTEEEAMTSTLTRPELTASDRCDRCGAAARVRAVLPSGGELLFCNHHAREHSTKLKELAAEIQASEA
jgi:hypothetical protein